MHSAVRMMDGSVAIMQTAAGAMVEDCIAKWSAAQRAAVVSHVEIDPSTIPADRSYRDAWTHDGTAFRHDMTKARQIHRDRLRVARAPRMAALDIAYQRADEANDTAAKARIAAQKQALRDVPAHRAIDLAVTPETLSALTLDGLCTRSPS